MRERIEPGSGQESVWDYPRPPRVQACDNRIEIVSGGITIADTKGAFRVLETSHPPVYYLPPEDIRMDLLRPSSHGSYCEWKGHAYYFSLTIDGREIPDVAWCYRIPTDRFAAIAGFLAFYPSKMDKCLVDGEHVQAQEGDFYGGWITSNIVGPFKGGPGSWGW
ncbi:MAG: DUF427 domain-containing protein [Phycisphaera sp. RhM]|nr:DUF427 domain-containing protein [Phycisphaera sp. RhM]